MAANARPTVLVVDDEKDILTTIAGCLASAFPSVRVRTATSGEEALRILAAEGADLVVSDYRLPGMDGLQLLATVRSLAKGTRLVLMTAYPDTHIAIRAVNEARIQQFLTKPFEAERLRALVEELLRQAK